MKNNNLFSRSCLTIYFLLYFSFGFANSDIKNCLYPPTDFQTSLRQWSNQGLGIEHFDSWLFKPGALFGVSDIWWQTKNNYTRKFPHEGIDFYFYKNKTSDTMFHVKEGTPIPLIYSGKLVSVFKDFIGQTFVFSTNKFISCIGHKYQFYIIYSHVKPINLSDIKIGNNYIAGTTLFSFNNQKKNFAPAHLHVTTFWANSHFAYDNLSWEILDTSPDVILVNPVSTEAKSPLS